MFLALCIATGLVWEPTHDEGALFEHSVGPMEIERERPVPVSALYEMLGGRSDHSVRDLLALLALPTGQLHPPAYYLLVHAWTGLFGTGRIAMSLPAYLMGVLSLLGMARLANRLVPESGAAGFAVLLLALSPWFVGYTNLARPYAAVLCISIWSTVAVLALDSTDRRTAWRVGFVGLSLLGLYTLYHYVFVLAWHAVFLAWLAYRRGPGLRGRELGALAVMLALVVVGFAPWLPNLAADLQVSADGDQYFSGLPTLLEWPRELLQLLFLFVLWEAHTAWGEIALAIFLLVLVGATLPLVVRAFRRSARADLDSGARALWATAPLVPALVLCGDLWNETHTFFVSKTSSVFLPLLLLLVVRAWRTLPSTALAHAGLVAWAVLLGAATVSNVATRGMTQIPFETVALHLKRSDAESHLVIVSSSTRGYAIPLLLTLRDAGVERVRVQYAPSKDLASAVTRALGDPLIERVSLIDLAVGYRPEQRYGPQQLEQSAELARAVGWRVRVLPLDAQVPTGQGPEHTLWILSPVDVKYFAM